MLDETAADLQVLQHIAQVARRILEKLGHRVHDPEVVKDRSVIMSIPEIFSPYDCLG